MNVYQAWAAVMTDVQAVGKDGFNQQQEFNFRGIDGVMNAVGPALRRHGVTVVPKVKDLAIRHYQTSKGTQMKETTVWVRYRIYGPEGDHFDGLVPGESADSGDKSTAKAMSVAYRTFLLQALTIPTDEPDPDEQIHERSAPDPRVAHIAELVAAWHETDPRRSQLTDARDEARWPARLADYDDDQLTACVRLVENLNAQEPFDLPTEEATSPAPPPENPNPTNTPEGRSDGQTDQQTEAGEAGTANARPPVTVVFSQALAVRVSKDRINAAAAALKLDVPRSGSKTSQLNAFSQACPELTAEQVVELIETTAPKETSDA